MGMVRVMAWDERNRMAQMFSTRSCACSFQMRLCFAVITELDLYLYILLYVVVVKFGRKLSAQIRFIVSLIG